MDDRTDDELVRMILAGEHGAFQELIRRYEQPIASLIRYSVGELGRRRVHGS